MSAVPKFDKLTQVARAFTPSAPVNNVQLFADRPDQVMACFQARYQVGRHIALYGERGVGKTSLANVIPALLTNPSAPTVTAARVDCNTNDDYNSIWRKIFRELGMDPLPGFDTSVPVDPEDIRFALGKAPVEPLIVVDEFDRVENDEALSLLADTVKTLSDHGGRTTLMFVGVADSIETLLGEHESIIRNVEQVPMPRMSIQELTATLDRGFAVVDSLEIDDNAKHRIVYAAEGLPHFAHVLGLHAAQRAVYDDRDLVCVPDVERAEQEVMRTHSMVSEYRRATQSPQPGHLFEEVLLACAYAPRDSLGAFRPADLRAPLSAIVKRDMDIPRFQRHLSELSGDKRRTLYKEGEPRQHVYRFRNPLLQPFVKMVGRAKQLISTETENTLRARQSAASSPNLFEPI